MAHSRKKRNLGSGFVRWKVEEVVVMIVITTLLIISTLSRNEVWQSGISLWEDCVKKSPNKVRTYQNLGAELLIVGEYERAKKVFLKAVPMDPKDYVTYYNLAICYYRERDLHHAYAPARRAAELHKDTMTLYQLGITLRDMGWKTGMPSPDAIIEYTLPLEGTNEKATIHPTSSLGQR